MINCLNCTFGSQEGCEFSFNPEGEGVCITYIPRGGGAKILTNTLEECEKTLEYFKGQRRIADRHIYATEKLRAKIKKEMRI